MRLLRNLIVLITLIPVCLCFAQESANKPPSSSAAQKPEPGLQKSDSGPIHNPSAKLPPVFTGLLSKLRKLELSPEANSWAVQIFTGGGYAGRGRGNLTITSRGHLFWNARENQCNVNLRDDAIQMLTQTAFSANVSAWSGPTDTYCSDCFVYAMVLQRREQDGIERTYIAYWDDSTEKKNSDELRKVYNTFLTHRECKQ
jgi:hypothetical protein